MEFNAYLRGVQEASTAASTTLATLNFRTHPPPSWEVCLQRMRVLSGQLNRLHELLYGGSGGANADAFSAGALSMGQNELARQISLAKQATVIPTVSGVDPTLNLRTKAIFELSAAQTHAATVAAPTEYPALFGAPTAGSSSGAAAASASTASASGAAAPAAFASGPGAAAPGAVPMPRLDDPVAAEQLSSQLEHALDNYNAHCVSAMARCQQLAKQWSASSVSTFVSSVMASSAPTAPAAAAAAGAGAGSGTVSSAAALANSNSVAAAQTAAKRKQRERDTRVDLADLLRVELQGRRLK